MGAEAVGHPERLGQPAALVVGERRVEDAAGRDPGACGRPRRGCRRSRFRRAGDAQRPTGGVDLGGGRRTEGIGDRTHPADRVVPERRHIAVGRVRRTQPTACVVVDRRRQAAGIGGTDELAAAVPGVGRAGAHAVDDLGHTTGGVELERRCGPGAGCPEEVAVGAEVELEAPVVPSRRRSPDPARRARARPIRPRCRSRRSARPRRDANDRSGPTARNGRRVDRPACTRTRSGRGSRR